MGLGHSRSQIRILDDFARGVFEGGLLTLGTWGLG